MPLSHNSSVCLLMCLPESFLCPMEWKNGEGVVAEGRWEREGGRLCT